MCMWSAGLPIEVLIKYVGLIQEGDQAIEMRKEFLIEQRVQLAANTSEMQKTLELLDYKIDVYKKALFSKEHEMILVKA